MKKLVVSVLVLAMCLGFGLVSLAPVAGGDGVVQPPAFADIAGHEAEGSLTLLAALGVYTGSGGLGGAVKPDDPITRAEFCKVVVTAVGRASTAAGLAGLEPAFTDGASIPTWAWGYVNVAVYMGIITGYADGSFGPANQVTYAEAVTMLVRAVPGHAAQVASGIWPYNFLFYAVDNGFAGNKFTGQVDVGFANLPATRGDVARMVVATLTKEKLDAEGQPGGGARLLLWTDTLRSYSLSTGTLHLFGSGEVMADKVWLVGGETYEDFRGLPVWLAAANGEEPVPVFLLAQASASSIVTGIFKELGDTDEDYKYDCFVLLDGTKVPYAEDTYEGYGEGVDTGDWGYMVPVMLNNEAGYNEFDLQTWGGDDPWGGAGAECVFTIDDQGLAVNVIAAYFESSLANGWMEGYTGGGYDCIEEITPPQDYDPNDYNTWTALHTKWSDWWGYEDYLVPNTCAVTINGAPAKVSDLRAGDVLDVAVDYAAYDHATDFWSIPYVIRAHREVVEGLLTAKAESYPGEVHRVTLKLADGSSKTYTLNDGVSGNADINYDALVAGATTVKWGLDFDGKAFENIGYATSKPIVLVTGWSESTAGTDTGYAVTVDELGVAKTYECASDLGLEANIDHFVLLDIDGGTGLVESAHPLAPFWTYVVASAGAETVTLDAFFSHTYSFLDKNFVVYGCSLFSAEMREEGPESELTYIGLPGLATSGSDPAVVDYYYYTEGLDTWVALVRVQRGADEESPPDEG